MLCVSKVWFVHFSTLPDYVCLEIYVLTVNAEDFFSSHFYSTFTLSSRVILSIKENFVTPELFLLSTFVSELFLFFFVTNMQMSLTNFNFFSAGFN